MKKPLIAICLATTTLLSSMNASSENVCSTDEYVVGFFNGVWNTPDGATASLALFQKMAGSTFNGEKVNYELFYNNTGSEVNATRFQDLAEVFAQRAEEIDPSLGERYDVLLSTVWSSSDGFLGKVRSVVSFPTDALLIAVENLYDEIASETLALVTDLFSHPPTLSDYEKHNTRITTLTSHGAKLLYVAHSQGNLFVNQAYSTTLSQENYDSSNVKVLHIAPASVTLNGPYVLADIDIVINSLRASGHVAENNVILPASHLKSDSSGHTFAKTYLNKRLDTYNIIETQFNELMGELQTPIATATQGLFTATLTWNGSGDVDLHTFEPDNQQVYYNSKIGNSGNLDVDNTSADGPEHYYVDCEDTKFQLGTYRFGVNNFSRAEGREAVIQISNATTANIITQKKVLGPAEGTSGNSNPEIMVSVTLRKDGDKYSVSVN